MVRIGTDWFVKVECPRPDKVIGSEDDHIRACMECPYVIWEKPEMVAGFMASMCGVRVGSIGMAASLDAIGERLAGTERFTKKGGNLDEKLAILNMIKAHIEKEAWRFSGMTKKETLEQIDLLFESELGEPTNLPNASPLLLRKRWRRDIMRIDPRRRLSCVPKCF